MTNFRKQYGRLTSALWLLAPLVGGLGLLWYLRSKGLLDPPGGELAAITVVWRLSAGVLLLGMGLAVIDIVRVMAEAIGAQALRTGQDPQQSRTWFVSGGGSSAARRYVELERLRKAIEAGVAVPVDWLSTAHRSTRLELAPIGAATRALAALLLLLAVLGTFAGMREALPGLTGAIGSAADAPRGGGVSLTDLGTALQGVADAFGANLLALAGSAILGLAAFGVTRSRSSILETIGAALDSSAGLIGREATGHDLHSAIVAVENAAKSVAGTTGAIRDLRGSLDTFQGQLADALERLGSNVNRTIQVRLEEQVAGALREVSTNFGEVASAVSGTAVAYEGMVAAMGERNVEIERGTQALRGASEGATATLVGVQAAATSSVDKLTTSLREAELSASRSIGEHVERLSTATERHAALLSDDVRQLADASTSASRSIDQATQGITSTATLLENSLNGLTELQEELGGVLRDQLNAIGGLDDSTAPIVERFDRALLALESAAGSTAMAIRQAQTEVQDLSLTYSTTVSDLAADLRSQFASSLERMELAAAKQADLNTEALKATREAFENAAATFERTEVRLSTSLTALGTETVQALRALRTVELSPRTIQALAEASRARRRLWPFGWRR